LARSRSSRLAIVLTAFALAFVSITPAVFAQAQTLTPEEQAARARAIAQARANGRQLTVYDREGKVLQVVGERDLYNQPSLSPDGSRIVVIKTDPERETAEAWVMDVATGKGAQIYSGCPKLFSRTPARTP
jgi:Tol biopolymer transport system component